MREVRTEAPHFSVTLRDCDFIERWRTALVILSVAKDLIAAGNWSTFKLRAMRSFATLRMTREMRVQSINSQTLSGAKDLIARGFKARSWQAAMRSFADAQDDMNRRHGRHGRFSS
jgi:hypothetical protein